MNALKKNYFKAALLVFFSAFAFQLQGIVPKEASSGYRMVMPESKLVSQEKLEKRFLSPGEVADFFLHPKENCNKCFVGVSDPGMDSLAAVKQALNRAAIIQALSKKTEINFITDFYSKMIHDKKWEVFAHLFEVALKTGEMKADSVMINQFGEAVVLASPINKLLSDKKRIMLSGFIQEKTYGGLADYVYRFEVKNPVKSVFLVRIVNDNYSVQTVYASGKTDSYPLYNYHYGQSIPCDTSLKTPGFSMKSGLWPSFLGSILKSLFLEAKETAEYEVGNMRDTYSEELDARLKRQTGNNRFTMRYEGCEIYSNRIYPQITIYPKK